MDEQLVRKSYRSIGLLWAIAMMWSLALWKPWVGLSITIGVALGTAVLATYDVVVRKLLVPGARKPGRKLLLIVVAKYLLIGALLYALVRWDKANLPAFCGGIVLVHIAILAKLAGIRLVERRMAQATGSRAFDNKEI